MFAAQHIPYNQTNSFSKLILDYLEGAASLQPFYRHAPTLEGIRASIEARRQYPTNRQVLVDVLKSQYTNVSASSAVTANIEALLDTNTYTVCTAHQPNLFTGPLY
ncbi:MAG: bacillithiol biosynthesis cysteine-adding enzyme BshC, partial [Bacteroidota bacterium]|nr:bacillithiol biosynthesis cysteine-adding enzyme BshC [Bacteroidota bacterium]